MKATHTRRFQRNDVIDVMLRAGRHRATSRQCIEFRDCFLIRPCWSRFQLPRLVLHALSVQRRLIVDSPLRVSACFSLDIRLSVPYREGLLAGCVFWIAAPMSMSNSARTEPALCIFLALRSPAFTASGAIPVAVSSLVDFKRRKRQSFLASRTQATPRRA